MTIDEPEHYAGPEAVGLPVGKGLGPMNCKPSMEALYRYMDGQLDTQLQAEVAAHLSVCDGCDDLYHFENGLRQLLETRCRSQLPAHLPQRVFQALAGEVTGQWPDPLRPSVDGG